MSLDWLQIFFNSLLERNVKEGPLRALSTCAAYMLFTREGQAFRLLTKEGYKDPSFFYSFLRGKPYLLVPLLQDGYLQLPQEEASQADHDLWVAVDQPGQPEYLLVAELPSGISFAGPLLRVILNLELVLTQSSTASEGSKVDMPVWLQDILPEFLEKKSPLLIVAEAGSGKEELVHAFLREKYGGLDSAVFFHPGRLSQAVQLRELFGDPAGARLGGVSPGIPIVHRKESVVVIQEAGDLDPLAQLRLLALFSSKKKRKLWIFETSRDLKRMTAAEQFLPGLNEVLWKNTITLPPLRACLDRLAEEVDRLIHVFHERYRRDVRLDTNAYKALSSYHWPGNWRELRNTLESAFLMVADNIISEQDLRLGRWSVPEDWDDLNLRRHSKAIEKTLLLRAYALHAGNQVQMARALGISRGSLQYKLDKHHLN